MTSESAVARWLDDTASTRPATLLHPGDEFPLRTFSNPPSTSSLSDAATDSDAAPPPTQPRPAIDTSLFPTGALGMETSTRRRSSSLTGPAAAAASSSKERRHRARDAHIAEEDSSASDSGEHSARRERTKRIRRRDHSGHRDHSTSDSASDDMSADGLDDDEETGLTRKVRRKNARRKRRNTLLDNRIVPDAPITFTKEEKALADQSLYRSMLVNAVLILLWYLFSISISVYNKWMFKVETGDGAATNIFPFPLFTTCLHMLVQFSLASLVLFLVPSLRPRHDALNPHAPGARVEPVDPKKPLMTKWFYFSRIGPCGAATGMDIGLGNTSLKFISLTFFTMCKSSALGFVLIFAFLFRLEQPSWRLVLIIAIMTLGVVMMVAGETAFHALGFILVMASACSSGFRWSLTQILLLRNPATANPFSSIFFLAPVMFTSIFVLAVPVEGFGALQEGLARLFDQKGTALGIGILIFPGCLAFLMTSSEFALLKRTSVVTLSICGIFKEVVTITTANLVFNDPLTPINLTGLVVTIASIALYNYMKIKKMREEHLLKAHLDAHDEYAPVRTADPDRARVSLSSHRGAAASLQLAPAGTAARSESPARASPVKRPEDLD
ncbi:triose-phosphate transporter family-domain-containing protein [Boeremia exigua]|uniref:triose-phosphate transporter family-domain-containing protein n=1 Tax=Boeremia exigua TaxID=749465 RepID=UPI001E8CBC4E|nr:triose-phosphate transporter family-domain-containing protein [Boeremia exigua]KAH6644173.1 triose-phosphate transporter family-domain-containing protein [Boeremia exigua]